MDWLQLDHITLRTVLLWLIALVAGWMVLKATKHLLLSLLCLAIGVLGIAYLSGVITFERVQSAGGAVVDKAAEGVQVASDKAKALGQSVSQPADGATSQPHHSKQRGSAAKPR